MDNSTQQPRRFTALMAIAGVAAFAVIVGYIVIDRKNAEVPASQVAASQKISAVPGGSGTPEYDQSVTRENMAAAQQAAADGKSYVPVPVGTMAPGANLMSVPFPGSQTVAGDSPGPQSPASVAGDSVPYAQTNGNPQGSGSRSSYVLAELKSVAKQMDLQKPEIVVSNQPNTNASTPTHGGHASARKQGHNPSAIRSPIKIGTIFYAVVDTALNSQHPGPAMATVLSGKYTGAHMLGGFSDVHNRLVVKFTTFVPKTGAPFAISGYAVNPNTSATAVATNVNHHYLSRWGGLVAASFLQGFGQAVANSGATTMSTVGTGGATSLTYRPTYSLSAETWQALGQVGQTAGQVMQQNFNEPATVRVAVGTNIGILIVKSGGAQ